MVNVKWFEFVSAIEGKYTIMSPLCSICCYTLYYSLCIGDDDDDNDSEDDKHEIKMKQKRKQKKIIEMREKERRCCETGPIVTVGFVEWDNDLSICRCRCCLASFRSIFGQRKIVCVCVVFYRNLFGYGIGTHKSKSMLWQQQIYMWNCETKRQTIRNFLKNRIVILLCWFDSFSPSASSTLTISLAAIQTKWKRKKSRAWTE